LKAAVPDLLDHEIGDNRDEGIKAMVEAAIGTIDPFIMAMVDAAGDASEVYDHAALAYAAIDCASRVYAGEQFSAPESIAPPAVPVLPPPPPNWSPMVVPMEDPMPTAAPKGGGSGGSGGAVAGVIGALVVGGMILFGALHLAAGGSTPTPDVVASPLPPSVAVLSVGSYACKTTLHGGFAAESNCTDTVKISINGDVPSQGVNLLMDMPDGTLHGSVKVATGWRGTITVAMTSQGPGYTCTVYPSYPTTAYVYDGMVVNSGPLLAQGNFTYKLGCS
jgi:hypothetical protein